MEEATLARWLKKEGDRFESGDVIAEIETDKATIDFEATEEGIIAAILVPAGTQGVKVDQPIALILGENERGDEIKTDEPAPKPAPAVAARSVTSLGSRSVLEERLGAERQGDHGVGLPKV